MRDILARAPDAPATGAAWNGRRTGLRHSPPGGWKQCRQALHIGRVLAETPKPRGTVPSDVYTVQSVSISRRVVETSSIDSRFCRRYNFTMSSKRRLYRGVAGFVGTAATVVVGTPVDAASGTPGTTCPSVARYCLAGEELSGTGYAMNPGWSVASNRLGPTLPQWENLGAEKYSDGGYISGRVKSARNRDTLNGATQCLYYADIPETSYRVDQVLWSHVGWKNIKQNRPSDWNLINVNARNPGSYPTSQGNCPSAPFW